MNKLAGVVAALSVAVLGAVLFYAYSLNKNRPPRTRDLAHMSEYDERMRATHEGPPVIVLSELEKRGLDSESAELIEPHFHVLNAALVTLVELQAKYDSAAPGQQLDLNARAFPFHTTADRHQREIMIILPMPQESIFDNYVQERKRVAGLRDWHSQHREENPPSGLIPPRGGRH